VNKTLRIKKGVAHAFVGAVILFLCGCTQGPLATNGRQSYEFVDYGVMRYPCSWESPKRQPSRDELLVLREFMEWLAEDDRRIYPRDYRRTYALEGYYLFMGSINAAISVGSSGDVYYILELANVGRTRYFSLVPPAGSSDAPFVPCTDPR
jgi:hypothetical protein